MRNFYLFLRRVAGVLGLVFGSREAREAQRQLKKLDTARYASRMISDAVLMNDIPSPSHAESLRMDFVQRRLSEFGLTNVFTDEVGNVLAFFPAFGTRRDFVLVAAEVGDASYSPLANAVRLSGGWAVGRGMGDRSLGAAALLVFAEFAQESGFHLDKNLLVLFTLSSDVDEREAAFRHFLDLWGDRIACGVFVKGTGLGVVGTRHLGSYRLSLSLSLDTSVSGPRSSAAVLLGALAERLGGISAPSGQVTIVRMEAGQGFGHEATHGEMDVEIVAEDDKELEVLKLKVTSLVEQSAESRITIDTLVRLRRSAGDPSRNAPLVGVHRSALRQIMVPVQEGDVAGKVCLLNEMGIPAVALGITNQGQDEERIELTPLAKGFRHLLLVVEGASRFAKGEER